MSEATPIRPDLSARGLEDYPRLPVIPQTKPLSYHPETSGKLERFRETLKAQLNLLLRASPESLREAMAEATAHLELRQYLKALADVAPSHVYVRREDILDRAKQQKRVTADRRFPYNLGQALDQVQGDTPSELRLFRRSRLASEVLMTDTLAAGLR
jgi:hypothetical protein